MNYEVKSSNTKETESIRSNLFKGLCIMLLKLTYIIKIKQDVQPFSPSRYTYENNLIQ